MAERSPLIRIGTSGWHYPRGRGAWTGIVYPPPKARGGADELTWYADRFHTVEVNASFYRDLDHGITAKWAARTPAGFEFAIKLHQQFTHPRMHAPSTPGLTPVPEARLAALHASLDALAPLREAGRLGPLLAQFPASFRATPEALAYLQWLTGELHGVGHTHAAVAEVALVGLEAVLRRSVVQVDGVAVLHVELHQAERRLRSGLLHDPSIHHRHVVGRDKALATA